MGNLGGQDVIIQTGLSSGHQDWHNRSGKSSGISNDQKWHKQWFFSASAMQVFSHVFMGHQPDGDSEKSAHEPLLKYHLNWMKYHQKKHRMWRKTVTTPLICCFLGSQFKEYKEGCKEAWSWTVQVSHTFCGKIFAQMLTLYLQDILCKIFSHPNKE